jgi:predicted lipid-binding transport protein (Tim44 family)
MLYSSKILKSMAIALVLSGATMAFVDARPSGSRGSMGSKGGHSGQSAPSTNTTAPRAGTPASPSQAARAPEAAKPSFMSRFGTGIAAGLLGAGLFGLLSGSGIGGALGSMGGILMLLLQLAVVFFVVRFAINFFRKKQEPALTPALAGAAPYAAREMAQPLGGSSAPAAAAHVNTDAVGLAADDFNTFEQRLTQVQDAYGREALDELRPVVTPEMLKIFGEDIAENTRKGVHNSCGGAKLLQGDLAESWREGTTDYASLAMRYSLFDVTRNRADGRVIEGSMTTPLEITEVWTFVRYNGGAWMLSAIEQA